MSLDSGSLGAVLNSIGSVFNSVYSALDSVVIYSDSGIKITILSLGIFLTASALVILIYLRVRQSPPI